MKKVWIRIIIVACALGLLTGLTIVEHHIRSTTYLGMTIMDRNSYLNHIADKTYVYDPEVELYYEDTQIPYVNAFGSYLFPIGPSQKGMVKTNKEYDLILVYDDTNQFKTNLSDNIPFELCLVDGNTYDVKTITFTNLPLINVNGYTKIDQDNYGSFTLIDPDNERHLYDITTSDVKYHRRGNYTATAPKPSFKLTLLDEKWESEPHDLLDLRDDDDWILQSMVTDSAKVKEKLAIDMWSAISDRYQLGYEYVEVIIDGAYMGVYGLVTPVDHKTFEGSRKSDLLIDIDTWGGSGDYSNSDNWTILANEDKCAFNEYEVKPCSEDDKEEIVGLISTLHDDINAYALSFDLENCADYQLFLNMTLGVDNTYKNQRLCLSEHGDTISIVKGVWDFDFCFQFDDTIPSGIYTDGIVPDPIRNDPQYFKRQCDQYQTLRENQFSDEALLELLDGYNHQLILGGALIRDELTWDYSGWAIGAVDHYAALDLISKGLTSRLQFLDDYYQY